VTPFTPAVGSPDADKAFLAGHFDQAAELYRQRVLANPDDLDAHDGLTNCAAKQDKLRQNAAWYTDQLNTKASFPGWCYGGARAMFQAGDRPQASALCYEALARNRGLGRAYYLLGLWYSTQAVPDYQTASNSLQKAVQYEPSFGPAYYQLAKIEAGVRGNRTQAKALVSQGLPLMKPVQKDVKFLSYVLLGGLLVADKEYESALNQFDQARTLEPDRIYDFVDFGRLYLLWGKTEQAVREWKDVQKRFGLASPNGLLAYRSMRCALSKVAVDYSNFLPGGAPQDYEILVSHLLKPRLAPGVGVPTAVAKLLNEIKTPVQIADADLYGDGKPQVVVVEARQVWDADVKGYYLSNPVLYVFTPKGGNLGFYDARFDHFWDFRVVDFDGDGKKEILFAAFSNPNVLNVAVLTRRDRRYLNTFAETVQCTIGACGVLVDDLDGDGKLEILGVSGGDLWVTVMRWSVDGTFSDASADFPDFYRDYVAHYEKLAPEDLERWPIVKEHLQKARSLLAPYAKKPETPGK
jgi:tetratricopeptide (TPR) repeat protein